MSGIRLHPTKGVNPHLGVCPRCGGDNGEIALVGANDGIYVCHRCKQRHVGRPKECAQCGHWDFTKTGELGENERIPTGLCKSCETEVAEHKKVVASGGVYFKCSDCGVSGAIRPNAFTEAVRKQAGVATPAPVGVEFSKADCPACGPNKV